MTTAPTLFGVAGLWFVAAAIPGPNLLAVARSAAAHGRVTGLRVALGVALGTCVWGIAGAFGVGMLFAAAPWLYAGLKVAGGLYIAWLGLKLIRHSAAATSAAAASPAAPAPPPSAVAALRLGIVTNLANPKTAAFVASLFAVTFPAAPAPGLAIAAVAVMAGVSIGWYGFAAMILSTGPAARAFAHFRKTLDRLAGALFIALGLKLALSER